MSNNFITYHFLNKNLIVYIIPIVILNGLLYFAIAVAGAENLQNFFQFNNTVLMYFISGGAAICYGMFTYKFFEFLTIRPKTFFSCFLAILSPFAASAFLTAGIEGATKLNIFNINIVIAIGVFLFSIRTINFVDGAVKFPDRLKEIKFAFISAFNDKDYKNLLCIFVVLYTTIGYSLSTTDSIYSASMKIANWLGFASTNLLPLIGYISAAIGAIVGLPMILYWTQRGMTQLTNSGLSDKNGIVRDPTDIYTYIGLFASLPVILGSLGAATNSSAQVFGQLGFFSEVVRISSSTIFAICGGIPGLSTLFRGIKHLSVLRQIDFLT